MGRKLDGADVDMLGDLAEKPAKPSAEEEPQASFLNSGTGRFSYHKSGERGSRYRPRPTGIRLPQRSRNDFTD